MNRPNRHVTRVQRLKVEGFRGIRSLDVDLDADIVLLTGPNGFGKTSLIDALCALLTGHTWYPLSSAKWKDSPRGMMPRIEASLNYNGTTEAASVQVDPKQGVVAESGDLPWIKGWEEIGARASIFFEDYVERLFDDRVNPLSAFLRPPLPGVAKIGDTLKTALHRLEEDKRSILSTAGIEPKERLIDRRRQAANEFKDAYSKLRHEAEGIRVDLPLRSPEWNLTIKSGDLHKNWQAVLRSLAEDIALTVLGRTDETEADVGPADTLRRLSVLAEEIGVAVSKKVKGGQTMTMLVRQIPDGYELPTNLSIGDVKHRLGDLRNKISRLSKWHSALERLERHFMAPSGVSLVDILTHLRQAGPDWLSLPPCPPNCHPPAAVLQWLERAVSSLDGERRPLDHELEVWLDGLRSERVQLASELGQVEQSRRSLEVLHQLLMSAAGDPTLTAALKESAEAGSVAKETLLQRVGGEDAHGIHDALAEFQKVVNTWRMIEEEFNERERKLRSMAGVDRAREYLDEVEAALRFENLSKSIIQSASRPTEDERTRYTELVNKAFQSFRVVEGVVPVSFRQSRGVWELTSKDGRSLAHLSTGQKSQAALSVLIGLNIALDRFLLHRIIALDDVTHALDMTQLTGICALFRRLAYGPGNSRGEMWERVDRRQLFISSHHEDLTNRLLDFLIPPGEECSMKILNFTNWTQEKGAVVEVLRVIPAQPVNDNSLAEVWKRLIDLST